MPCESQMNGATGTLYIDDCGGAPTELLGILNWRLTKSAKVPEYTATDTAGFEKTSKGSKGFRGSFEGRAKTGVTAPVYEGELYDVELYLDDSGSGNGFSATVRIESVGEILVDIDASNNVTFPCQFKGHGPISDIGAQSSSGV